MLTGKYSEFTSCIDVKCKSTRTKDVDSHLYNIFHANCEVYAWGQLRIRQELLVAIRLMKRLY